MNKVNINLFCIIDRFNFLCFCFIVPNLKELKVSLFLWQKIFKVNWELKLTEFVGNI